MAGTRKRTFGPVALSNVLTTNIYNQGSALIYDVIDHIMIVNKTAGPVSFSLYLGATGANAAGTEVIGNGKVVAANDVFHWYGRLKMTSADFLVGGASASASLTITAEGEQHVV
jgi:hypothetical protein